MATYEGTVDYFLRDIGGRIRDWNLNEGTDGRNSRARVMEIFNLSQRTLFRRARAQIDVECLTRKATLTQSSSDTTLWYLPARTIGIQAIEDADEVGYGCVPSRIYTEQPGVYIQNRTDALGKQLYFRDVTPSSTVYAWVLEDPVIVSSGTNAATSSTSITLNATCQGRVIYDADYYANAPVRITSGADAGEIRTISASTTGLVCTVTAWTTTPTTTTDTYSLVSTLPRELWSVVCAEAACLMAATDKEIIDFLPHLKQEAAESWIDAMIALSRPTAGTVREPRQTITWIQ